MNRFMKSIYAWVCVLSKLVPLLILLKGTFNIRLLSTTKLKVALRQIHPHVDTLQ